MRGSRGVAILGAALLAVTFLGACGTSAPSASPAQSSENSASAAQSSENSTSPAQSSEDSTSPAQSSENSASATTTPPAGTSALTVESNPVGAAVETGIQCVDGVVTPGTGRSVGTTPVTEVPITSQDLAECPSGVFSLYTNITLDGYSPYTSVLGFGDSRDSLGPRVYTIQVTLNRL